MKKNPKKIRAISPEEAVEFLESFRKMMAEMDEPTVPVSIRIPGNILRAIKIKSKAENKKYQSVIIQYLRKGLREDL